MEREGEQEDLLLREEVEEEEKAASARQGTCPMRPSAEVAVKRGDHVRRGFRSGTSLCT